MLVVGDDIVCNTVFENDIICNTMCWKTNQVITFPILRNTDLKY